MLRGIACSTVLIVIVSFTADVSAQRRQPLRSFARKIGIGSSAGLHKQNPGSDTSQYNPWSPSNTPQHAYQDVGDPNTLEIDPSDVPSVIGVHSVLEQNNELFDLSGNPQNWPINPPIEASPTVASPDTSLQPIQFQQNDSILINRLLKPFHSPTAQAPGRSLRSIFNGGQFIPPLGSQR